MQVTPELYVIPTDVGISISRPMAVCQRILAAAGLNPRLHAGGISIEGDSDAVFAAVKQCDEMLHGSGVPPNSTTMRFGSRVRTS